MKERIQTLDTFKRQDKRIQAEASEVAEVAIQKKIKELKQHAKSCGCEQCKGLLEVGLAWEDKRGWPVKDTEEPIVDYDYYEEDDQIKRRPSKHKRKKGGDYAY